MGEFGSFVGRRDCGGKDNFFPSFNGRTGIVKCDKRNRLQAWRPHVSLFNAGNVLSAKTIQERVPNRTEPLVCSYSILIRFCTLKKIFNNQVHGGMLLMEQNIHKKNRLDEGVFKTFHAGETPAFEQFPKETMEHVINALNLYSNTGYLINQKVRDRKIGTENFRQKSTSTKTRLVGKFISCA